MSTKPNWEYWDDNDAQMPTSRYGIGFLPLGGKYPKIGKNKGVSSVYITEYTNAKKRLLALLKSKHKPIYHNGWIECGGETFNGMTEETVRIMQLKGVEEE